MAFRKFGSNDIVLNTIKAYPNNEFFIFRGQVWYNENVKQSGSFTSNVTNVPSGFISLYEYNIDKLSGSMIDPFISPAATMGAYGYNNYIYPFIYKGSARASFRTAVGKTTTVSPADEWATTEGGDVLYGAYPLSASISRDYTANVSPSETIDLAGPTVPAPRNFYALKNRLRYYGIRSPSYKALADYPANAPINVISIPSIFYGSKIKPGSVSLKWYFTGSLAGELRDTKHNGQLIQTPSGTFPGHAEGHDYRNQVAGVVLYDEGVIILTGSWRLNHQALSIGVGGANQFPSWEFWASGLGNDEPSDVPVSDGTTEAMTSASFGLSFKGITETQVMTMFAHARRGGVNYSNNPTFLKYGQEQLRLTSSQVYEENPNRLMINTVSSSYSQYSASFERQVYISRVAIYDDSKNLLGMATLSNPIRKAEDQDITFKLKLDI
jgi:hypothetical protein